MKFSRDFLIFLLCCQFLRKQPLMKIPLVKYSCLFLLYFPSAVNRLREHWDETSQSVLQRKSQLTNMLGDSQR